MWHFLTISVPVSIIQINNMCSFLFGPPWKALLHIMLLCCSILSFCPYASCAKLGKVENLVEREEAYIKFCGEN